MIELAIRQENSALFLSEFIEHARDVWEKILNFTDLTNIDKLETLRKLNK